TNWGNITSYSIGTGGYQPHPAIGSYGGNGKLSLVWNIANNVYVATYNGSCWSVPGILASGTNGGSECSINSSTPSLLAALWRKPDGGISITTNGVNPNWECGAEEESIAGKYSVGGDSSVVPVPYRLNRHGLVEMPRAIGGSNKSVRGTMAFEIAGMKLVTPEGVETLEYEDLNALPHGRSELSSKPFTVSEANSQLIFAGAAYGKRLAIPEDSLRTVAQPLALVRLREHADGNPREQVWRLPFSNLSSIRDSTYGEYREFTVDLAEYGGKELYVEVEMLGRALRVAPLIDDDYLILPGQMHVTAGNSFAKAADKTLPTAYALYQNYPNPFNPTTTIRFDLPEAQIVSLKVFNVLGQLVTELANAEFDAGEHSVVADFTNLPSGMYFYSITAGSFTDVKKLLLIR
ncbi:MAG TPA: T9SS type A sorting domain-containing protein, partial [Bacteroidota bacterium]